MKEVVLAVLSGALALSALGCGSTQHGDAQPPVTCTSVKYEGIRTEGGAGVLKVADVKYAYEQQAIREMDVHVERYRAAMQDLCSVYQSGGISGEQYLAEMKRIQALLEPASEYVTRLNATAEYGERKRLITELHQTLVPQEVREQALLLEFSLDAVLPDGQRMIVAPGAQLPSQTKARFRLGVNQTAYVYIFQRNATTNEVSVLFPHQRIGTGNPLRAGTDQLLPPAEYFVLDEKDLGTEHVYIVASPRPIGALDAAAAKVQAGATVTADQDATLGQLSLLAPGKAESGCTARAFDLPAGPVPPASCARSRGWVLPEEGESGRQASMTVRADPGDDTIVKDFPFEHTSLEDWQRRTRDERNQQRGILVEW